MKNIFFFAALTLISSTGFISTTHADPGLLKPICCAPGTVAPMGFVCIAPSAPDSTGAGCNGGWTEDML